MFSDTNLKLEILADFGCDQSEVWPLNFGNVPYFFNIRCCPQIAAAQALNEINAALE